MAHRHVDLGAVAAERFSERLRYRGQDVRRAFESRHHGVEADRSSVVAPSAAMSAAGVQEPRRGLATRLLLSIATRTDAD